LIEAVRLQIKDEVDAIKVSGSNDNLITPDALGASAFTLEELKLIADETRRLGKLSSIHARSCESARDSALAGFDNIFHASYIDGVGIEACLKNNVVITLTLTLLVNLFKANPATTSATSADEFNRELAAASKDLDQACKA